MSDNICRQAEFWKKYLVQCILFYRQRNWDPEKLNDTQNQLVQDRDVNNVKNRDYIYLE